MAAGLPVIATDIDGNREVINDRQNDLLVSPGDPAALADKIEYILDHPDQAREMADVGRRCVAREFSVEKMVTMLDELYAYPTNP